MSRKIIAIFALAISACGVEPQVADESIGTAQASLALRSGETLGTRYYALTFGAVGTGADSLVGTGMYNDGAFSSPPEASLRLFDPIGSQKNGVYDIAYKNIDPWNNPPSHIEDISALYPNRVPAVGSSLYGGGTFDGTALWVGHSRFQAGHAPVIGVASPPGVGIRWDGKSGSAGFGVNARSDDAHLINVPVTPGVIEKRSFLISAQVYVPAHDGAWHRLNAQPFLAREGFGVTYPEGTGGRQVDFSSALDRWNLLEVRADIETDGGSLPDSSDDRGRVTYSYFLNGVQVGQPLPPSAVDPTETMAIDPYWMQRKTGPLQVGVSFGARRGWEWSTPEAFLDNITVDEIRLADGTRCGDAVRLASNEECDLGDSNGTRATCSTSCRAQDLPVVVDTANVRTRSRTLGFGAHPLTGWTSGKFAAAFTEANDGVPSVKVAGIDANGVPVDKSVTVATGPSAIFGGDPVIAATDRYWNGTSVVAFTDSGADGDQLGVAIRQVYPFYAAANPLIHANTRTSSSQFDPDIVFIENPVIDSTLASPRLVVAWSDDSNLETGPDIYYRTFSPDLTVAYDATEQPLAISAEAEGNVALALFASSWAAAWRSRQGPLETIHAKAGAVEWVVGPFRPGPVNERPAITELDATHLLVTFTEGADLSTPGVYTEGRLRVAVLDTSAPGSVVAQDVVSADLKSRDQPTAARVGSGIWIAWRENASTSRADLVAKELVWNPISHALDLTHAPISLSRTAVWSDRRKPALAEVGMQTLVAGWTDVSRSLGPRQHRGDVMIEAIQTPFGRLP